ncbi:mucin-5AC-like [Osmia bicornis bicornis]|uniref:mucin-5AC-like n=1 Tax=Osmia bicornis bicornis TaxID=1437191 RepID=UPI001EAF4426|nr:mucin-5AC-like [Osmia bicornis bicornis]
MENRRKDELNLIAEKVDSYYIEDNLADDEEENASFASKKRIDRQDSTVVTLRPTTMRGIPLLRLLHSQVPRGFYVTKSELELNNSEKMENDTSFTVDTTIALTENPTTVIVQSETSSYKTTNSNENISTIPSTNFQTFPSTLTEIETTTIAPSILSTDSTTPESSSAFYVESTTINSTSFDYSTVTEALFSTKIQPDSSTNAIATGSFETVPETVADVQLENATDSISLTTTMLPLTTVTERRFNRRREKFGTEFGQRSSTRRRVQSERVKPTMEDNLPVKRTEETVTPRRRVTVYRGRHRRPVSTGPPLLDDQKHSKVIVEPIGEGSEGIEETALSRKENNSTGKDDEAEVNSSKNTSAHSPGSLLATRLRRPAAFASTSQQSKSSNTFTNHQKNRTTDEDHSLDSVKNDAADKTTDTPKLEKDIDQSSRAQEIAVTLADPPPSPSTTGRPTLRNAFRRKISTTIAPRKDPTTTTTTTTTSRSTIRFTPVVRDRQKPRTRDKPVQNATTRPRRPQVIDYDYYEDEEESVIGRSTLNGKLFLTSKGSIRCLDQGNFPHPYSCRKFITCARMVNGLVVGAEYTCPEKLSFDPVGGICNWSAGLGCKE